MLVSHRYEFIYTKTFKTAGTSVEVFFEPYCMPEGEWTFSKFRAPTVTDAGIIGHRGPRNTYASEKTWYHHMPAREIRSKLGEEVWDSYFKFCVVRNPYDKAVSMYNWARRYSNLKTRLVNLATNMSTRLLQLDFQRFAHIAGVDRDKYVLDGSFCLDDVIFFERLQKDARRICNTLQLPVDEVDLPRMKTGFRKPTYDTVDYYNATSRRLIEENFRPEIEAFGYRCPWEEPPGPQHMPGDVDVEWA
jgi:hypothetical protein